MCRLLAYLGPPVAFGELLLDAPWALRRQSHAPRHQDVGRINADGWGVGWYDPSVDGPPARYRTTTPLWADHRFEGIARHLRAGHIVAAVRNASPGLPTEDSSSSPFVADRDLFTHNGYVDNWHEGVGWQLRRGLTERREVGIGGASDSEVLFAMVLDLVDKGTRPADALRATIADLHDLSGGRFNLLLSDGETILATRDGNSLFVRETTDGARIVASEPFDDEPGWHEVHEQALVTVTADQLTIEDL